VKKLKKAYGPKRGQCRIELLAVVDQIIERLPAQASFASQLCFGQRAQVGNENVFECLKIILHQGFDQDWFNYLGILEANV
jgi:hypothetical protein